MKNDILTVLVESGAITEERAEILSGVTTPCSAYGLYGDAGVEHFDSSGFLITDKELQALVKIENILSKEMHKTSRDITLPLLMVILVRFIEYAKNPNEIRKIALDDVLSSYEKVRNEMNKEISMAMQEQIDQYVASYKLRILKRILKK